MSAGVSSRCGIPLPAGITSACFLRNEKASSRKGATSLVVSDALYPKFDKALASPDFRHVQQVVVSGETPQRHAHYNLESAIAGVHHAHAGLACGDVHPAALRGQGLAAAR